MVLQPLTLKQCLVGISWLSIRHMSNKRSTGIEELKRSNNFALVIKSSQREGIFVDHKGENRTSLEIVLANKYFAGIFFGEHLDR